MASKRSRKRVAYGQLAESADGLVWTWMHQRTRFRWCQLGHLEVISDTSVTRVSYHKSLNEAFAYVKGLYDGIAATRRGGYHQGAIILEAEHPSALPSAPQTTDSSGDSAG